MREFISSISALSEWFGHEINVIAQGHLYTINLFGTIQHCTFTVEIFIVCLGIAIIMFRFNPLPYDHDWHCNLTNIHLLILISCSFDGWYSIVIHESRVIP